MGLLMLTVHNQQRDRGSCRGPGDQGQGGNRNLRRFEFANRLLSSLLQVQPACPGQPCIIRYFPDDLQLRENSTLEQ